MKKAHQFLTRHSSLVTVAAVAFAAAHAAASTVAYWPLAYENGVRTTTSTVFANQGDGGQLDAVPLSINCPANSDVVVLDGEDKDDYCPVGTNAFPLGYGVYDTGSGSSTPTPTGLYFHKESLNGKAGVLRVADPAPLRLQTFTVECFVRTTWPGGGWQCIAVMPGQLKNGSTVIKNCDSWGLRLTSPGTSQITLRLTQPGYTLNSNVISGTNKELNWNATGIQDGKWHHIAFSVNDSTKKCIFYYDYVSLGERALPASVWYNAGEDFFIGNTPQTAGPFGGSIAHFRISDEVLTPDRFLRLARTSAADDEGADTLLHLDFEPVDGITERWAFFNDAATGGPIIRGAPGTQFPWIDSYSPFSPAYGSLIDATGRTSAWCMTNMPAQYSKRFLSWQPEEDIFTNTSFTVECRYKSSGQLDAYVPLVRRLGGSNIQFNLGFDGSGAQGKLTAAVIQSDGTTKKVTDSTRTDDGEWHHAALVVDRARTAITLFRDYKAVAAINPYSKTLVATDNPVFVGGFAKGTTDYGSFKGAIDNVRITKRALSIGEFIRPDHATPEGKTLALVSFDNTIESSVPWALTNGIASAAIAGGAAPSFAAHGAGERIEDGNGNVLRAENLASLCCSTGVVKYAENLFLPLVKDQTIEFLVKSSGNQTPGADIVRCCLYKDPQPANDPPVWRIGFDASTGSSLVVRCVTTDVDATTTNIYWYGINENTRVSVNDGKWHHIALAISQTNGQVTASLYKDYATTPSWTRTTSGKLLYGAGYASVWVGASASTTAFFNGQIDELRISRGILAPTEFLRRGTLPFVMVVK